MGDDERLVGDDAVNHLVAAEQSEAVGERGIRGSRVVENQLYARKVGAAGVADLRAALYDNAFHMGADGLHDVGKRTDDVILGRDADDGSLVVAVAARVASFIKVGLVVSREERLQPVIAVAQAVPSPVDVEEPFPVVTVAYKGVSALRVTGGIDDGAAVIQFVIDDVVPFLDVKARPVDKVDGTAIAEEVLHGIHGIARDGSR